MAQAAGIKRKESKWERLTEKKLSMDSVKDWMDEGKERCQNLNINQVEPWKCF